MPRLHLHPEPLLLPGLTPATARLTWPPGTARRLRCLLLSGTRGLADFCQGVLPTGHGTLPALDTVHHTFLTPPQVQITATRAPGCSRILTPSRAADCILSLCPQALAWDLHGGPSLPSHTLAFLRLHQRFHLQGLQSEGVSPTRSPSLPWIRERSALMDCPGGIESHITESAIHHCCIPGCTRLHTVGGLWGGGSRLNICIKRKKFTDWGGAIFICCK